MIRNYRYNSAKEKVAQELEEEILSMNYWDTISLYKAAKILGYNIDDEIEKRKFQSMMNKIKNNLIEHGYILKSITGVGFYILKPTQIASYTYRTYIIRPLRLFEKAERILTHTEKTKLVDDRLKEYKEVNELNKILYKTVNDNIDESEYFKNKNYYDSLKD